MGLARGLGHGATLLLFGLLTLTTAALGVTLMSAPIRRSFNAVAPALGLASLTFGVWYPAAAWSLRAVPVLSRPF
jgi:hypothetical protein